MSCIDNLNCFMVDYSPAGVALSPQLDPSFENALKCSTTATPGLVSAEVLAATFCEQIHGPIFIEGLDENTSSNVPVFNFFTVTNPAIGSDADLYFAWYVEETRIEIDPGVRGTIVTRANTFPNPLVDVSYHVYQHGYDELGVLEIPGASVAFNACPIRLGPGASQTFGWQYGLQGSGAPGGWRAIIGSLFASALVVSVPL